jgi:Trypsin-co-occurring domain 1
VVERGAGVPEIVEFALPDGRLVGVEVTPAVVRGRVEKVGRLEQQAEAARKSFAKALDDVRAAAGTALERFSSMPSRPDEVEITFGVKFDARAGAVIAETGLSAHLQVKLTWARGAATPGDEDERDAGDEPADGSG